MQHIAHISCPQPRRHCDVAPALDVAIHSTVLEACRAKVNELDGPTLQRQQQYRAVAPQLRSIAVGLLCRCKLHDHVTAHARMLNSLLNSLNARRVLLAVDLHWQGTSTGKPRQVASKARARHRHKGTSKAQARQGRARHRQGRARHSK